MSETPNVVIESPGVRRALNAVLSYGTLAVGLVDTMGRAVHRRKRGAIAPATPPLLRRLGMDGEGFIACADHFFKTFASAVGTPARLIALAAQRQTRTLRGLAAARRVFEGGGAVQRGAA